MKNSGLSIHCHHDILIEHCYDYQERETYIKTEKPEAEIAIRLRLFKLLPPEVFVDLPEGLVRAYAECRKAYVEYDEALVERNKAYAELNKAYAGYGNKLLVGFDKACDKLNKALAVYGKAYAEDDKALAEWDKALAEWDYKERVAWHKKWCGCKEWNGKEIVFNQV